MVIVKNVHGNIYHIRTVKHNIQADQTVTKKKKEAQIIDKSEYYYYYYYYYYYWYSALRPTSGDWYGSGTLHAGQILRGSLPLLSPRACKYCWLILL